MLLSLLCGDCARATTVKNVEVPPPNNKHLVGTIAGLNTDQTKADMVHAGPFIEKMSRAAESYQDYSFSFTMKVFKGKKPVIEQGNFFFKKPRLIRLEETGDYKKGSVAVLTSEGRVKAHMGGGLSIFVVDLEPQSKLLKSANGHPMVESDFYSLTAALKQYLNAGHIAEVTKIPVRIDNYSEDVHLVEIRKSEGRVWKKIAVDADTFLPVQWWDYSDNGDLWSYATWVDFKPNQNLPVELFSIKEAKKLRKSSADKQS